MIRKITKDHPLKVLGFTDTHLDDYKGCFGVTLKLMRETIVAEQPDLVVFVGDNVTGGDNRERARIFQETMTELQVPWAPILGNHEGDNPMSMLRGDMAAEFRKSPYCLVPEQKPVLSDGTEVFGETNYVLPLKDADGNVVHKFIFLDSGTDMTEEEIKRRGVITSKARPDGCIQESQIAWYREQVKDDTCESTMFFHIPLPEFKEAFEKGELLFGGNHEGVAFSPYNSGMFDAVLEEGKTKTLVVGHDHVNDFRVRYKGLLLMYNRMSGMSSYNMISKGLSDKLLQGCTVYYVDVNGQLTVDDIYYEDRYPQYHEEIYSVIRKPGESAK